MLDLVVNRAKTCGFVCQYQQSRWEIMPQQAESRWKLQQTEDNWILLVGDVPQISLNAEEAIAIKHFKKSPMVEN